MRIFLLCVLAVLLSCSSVWALDLDADCSNIKPYCGVMWHPNSEPDMKEYKMYLRSLPTPFNMSNTALTIPHPTTEVKDVAGELGLSQNGDYAIVVTALDNAGNESGPSNEVQFHYAVIDLPPSAPEIEMIMVPIVPAE